MKKNLFLLSLLFFLCLPCAAQLSVDSRHDFYKDAITWQLKGYVTSLPQLKPYPINVITQILSEVMEKAPEDDALLAREYYEKMIGKWHVSLDGAYKGRLYSLQDTENDEADSFDLTNLGTAELSFSGDIALGKFGAGAILGLRGMNGNVQVSDVLPKYVHNRSLEGIEPFIFDAGSLDLLLDAETHITYGTERIFGSAGFFRPGYGPFTDSDIILNPSANPFLNASFSYQGDYYEYTQMFGLLTGTSVTDSDDYCFGKYLSFHSLNIPLFSRKFSVSYFESIVSGPQFMPHYLMPVPWVILANVAGFNENVLAGIKAEYKPVPCFSWNNELLFDDFQIKQFIKLKWNDAAVRTAFKTGLIYTPFDSICNFVSLDYMLVTPYTYSKLEMDGDDYNYRDYTNFDRSLGSELRSNSDKLTFAITFKPFNRLKITTSTAYARYGNLNQDLFDIPKDLSELSSEELAELDAEVSEVQSESDKYDILSDHTNFLNQRDIMYIMQASIDFEYQFLSKRRADVSVNFGYTFEYIKNDGVDAPLYSGFYTSAEQVHDEYESWKDALHNSYNHYFRAGVTVIF